jgi:uncharacterized protein (DUF1015 family)
MVQVRSFRALRPLGEQAQQVVCPPYDVIDTREARALAEGKPWSFLHVVRPEVDLEIGVDEHDDVVYETGASNLRRFAQSPLFVRDAEARLWALRMTQGDHVQTGVYGCVSVDEYDRGLIVRHEATRVDKEDDRTRHLLTQQAHAEPVLLTYRGGEDVDALLVSAMVGEADYDVVTPDGVRHEFWAIGESAAVEAAFGRVERLYVADGHHRCKAASRAAAADEAAEGSEIRYFPAAVYSMRQMRILPYHRLVVGIGADGRAELMRRLKTTLGAEPADGGVAAHAGEVRVFDGVAWWKVALPPTRRTAVADSLDVARLAEHVLEPMLGVKDPRTDRKLAFVGGRHGADELERKVCSGEADVAIAMFATPISALLEVSDAGELMPPKSTWFEPKLPSGVLIHPFGEI